ncbi:MAG: hypothetical protein J0J10_11280 [Bosea sp.]|jgi:hypothetical protein|uniref:hypothetical protein n=1 Tax=Bosea sp. (in: a-proteobacteria) TaxID=1871050 RepID=UPI001AC44FAC|nr:hypothetical protein [Bosea sp. (in: a-proteobacteria)]MBN9469344.1 hypothetical protein [Bosea sp. (in: a-proteobacteria)]
MTDNNAPSLRDLVFTTDTVPVIDELAGFDALVPDLSDDLKRLTALLERLPPILDLRGRALVHTQQYERFLALAEADPEELGARVDTANALAILAHAGEIAMLLVPSGSPENRFARAMLSKERNKQYRNGGGVHDPELMDRALRRSFAHGSPQLALGKRIPPGMENAAKRFSGAVLPLPETCDGTSPGVHHLEHASALEAWFNAPPDLDALLDGARKLLKQIDVRSQAADAWPFLYGARRGALILAYAKLCRIGLWPARSSADLIAKMEVERLITERAHDPDAMRALVEIALGVGRRIAKQSGRFLTILDGVEL